MIWKNKADFFRTGALSVIAGLIIASIGYISGAGDCYNLSSTYYNDIYWLMIVQLFGLALIVTGSVIIIVGRLRAD